MNIDLKCPHCHAALQAPSSLFGRKTKCPRCNARFTVPGNVTQNGVAVQSPYIAYLIYQYGKESSSVSPKSHVVHNPNRAIEFSGPRKALAASWRHVKHWVLVLVGSLLSGTLGLAMMWIDSLFEKDPLPLGIAGAFLFLASLITCVVAVFRCFTDSVGALSAGNEPPRMDHPIETLRTFFLAIDWKLWDRAYNCLTDTAQVLTDVPTPNHGQFARRMPRPEFDSLDSFEGFWEGIPDKWEPMFEDVMFSLPEQDVAVMSLPIEFRRVDIDGPREKIACRFVAVKESNWWFLVNGFFWPLSDYVAKNGKVPCRLCKLEILTATYDKNAGLCAKCNAGRS